MKNILFIGKFNAITENINQFLSEFFHVQVSSDNLDIVRGMLKVGTYDLIVINLLEWERKKLENFAEIRNQYTELPLICIGTDDETCMAAECLPQEKLYILKRPIANMDLLNMACVALGMAAEYHQEDVEQIDVEQIDVEQIVIESQEIEEEIETVEQTKDSRKHILLIDDSAIQLRALREFLKSKYKVSVATSSGEALMLMGRSMPDFIFLDYEMPICNGKITFEMLRSMETTKDIPIVFLTGINDKDHIQDVLSLKPEAYLLKPVTKDRIMTTLESILME